MNKVIILESKIKQRYQMTIPKHIRDKAKLDIGDELIWKYDKFRDEIIIIRKPVKFTEALWGLGKEIWEKEMADEYVKKERKEW